MTVRLFVPAADAAHPTVAYHSDLGHPVVEVTAGQGAPWLQFDDPQDVATWIAALCDARSLLINSGELHIIDLVPSPAPVGDGPAAQGITGAGAADESPGPASHGPTPGPGDDLPQRVPVLCDHCQQEGHERDTCQVWVGDRPCSCEQCGIGEQDEVTE